jgi:hypothetical protein
MSNSDFPHLLVFSPQRAAKSKNKAMMRDNLKHALYTILLLITCFAGQVLAQRPRRMGEAVPRGTKWH